MEAYGYGPYPSYGFGSPGYQPDQGASGVPSTQVQQRQQEQATANQGWGLAQILAQMQQQQQQPQQQPQGAEGAPLGVGKQALVGKNAANVPANVIANQGAQAAPPSTPSTGLPFGQMQMMPMMPMTGFGFGSYG